MRLASHSEKNRINIYYYMWSRVDAQFCDCEYKK